jgi:hypothetical protein
VTSEFFRDPSCASVVSTADCFAELRSNEDGTTHVIVSKTRFGYALGYGMAALGNGAGKGAAMLSAPYQPLLGP